MLDTTIYWAVHYIWEQPVAVPVTVIKKGDGFVLLNWQVCEEYAEELEVGSMADLYPTKEAAVEIIKKERAANG